MTTAERVSFALAENFNSHAHVERDKSKQERKENEKYFNSHAHVERDLGFFKDTGYRIDFNSHAHVERDMFGTNITVEISISTHTLTWSVTQLR